jgi:hypothetical protein
MTAIPGPFRELAISEVCMLRTVTLAMLLVSLGAAPAAAQQLSADGLSGVRLEAPLTVSLGALGTGQLMRGQSVGTIGLFGSNLTAVVHASPEAEHYARMFARDRAIGRPLLLAGAVALVGGFAAYVARGGQLGVGGREMAAIGLGAGATMYGAYRLGASRAALASSIAAFNRATMYRQP